MAPRPNTPSHSMRESRPLSPNAQGCPGNRTRLRVNARVQPKSIPMAGLDPWAFSPRTLIRGHPRLRCAHYGCVKTWMPGTSPGKGLLEAKLGAELTTRPRSNFPRIALPQAGRAVLTAPSPRSCGERVGVRGRVLLALAASKLSLAGGSDRSSELLPAA